MVKCANDKNSLNNLFNVSGYKKNINSTDTNLGYTEDNVHRVSIQENAFCY